LLQLRQYYPSPLSSPEFLEFQLVPELLFHLQPLVFLVSLLILEVLLDQLGQVFLGCLLDLENLCHLLSLVFLVSLLILEVLLDQLDQVFPGCLLDLENPYHLLNLAIQYYQ